MSSTTYEAPTITTMAEVRQYATKLRQGADRELTDFAKKYNEDPLYAFEWASAAVKAAAEQKVAKLLLNATGDDVQQPADFSEKDFIAHLVRHAFDALYNEARNPHYSTSPHANEAKRQLASAWADFYAFATSRI